MECENETTDTLTQFWMLFNEVLQKVSGDGSKRFSPFGWMADEVGANWAALANVFGADVLSHTILLDVNSISKKVSTGMQTN